jgi:hypothetical protein
VTIFLNALHQPRGHLALRRTRLLDHTRSTLTTLHRSNSLGTHKTKPGGQAESERNSATVCESTGTQRSVSTGISAGQAPRHDRSSSIVVGRYRMSCLSRDTTGSLEGAWGATPASPPNNEPTT